MFKRLCLGLATILFLSLVVSAKNQFPEANEGDISEWACISWDISGTWQYQVSRGGYGVMILNQKGDNLTGTWHNQSSGGSGTFYGQILGSSFGLHIGESEEELQGTVSSNGIRIGGTYEDVDYRGSWEAKGAATCLERQPPPVEGSARIEYSWGDYHYYVEIPPATGLISLQQQAPQVTVQRINTPFGALLTITARLRETGLPATITVVGRSNGGPEVVIGTLTRVSQGPGGSVYRGNVFVPATGLSPGASRNTLVQLIDPRNTTRRINVTIINQFLIDPAGVVYDTGSDAPIPDAMATLYKKSGSGWTVWPAEQFGQMNPLVTDPDGHYAWETDPGEFKVEVSKNGYLDGKGGPVTVPPPVLDLDIGMEPTTQPAPILSDLWISDDTGMKNFEFGTGQNIQAHLVVSNSTSKEVTCSVVWEVTGPDGLKIQSMSGTENYLIGGEFDVDIKIELMIPDTAKNGWHTAKIFVTQGGITRFKATQFWVEQLGIHRIFLPLCVKNFERHSPRPASPRDWQVIISDGFEESWPGQWHLVNSGSNDGGFWTSRNDQSFQGSSSAGAVDGSVTGLVYPGGHPESSKISMVYGPFSLADASASELRFWLRLNAESNNHKAFWGASTDGVTFNGFVTSGAMPQWEEQYLDLAEVPNVGSLLGQNQVWIAIIFDSSSGMASPEGVYIDNVLLRKNSGSNAASGINLFGAGNIGIKEAAVYTLK